MSKQLQRLWKSIPLPSFHQGSTLSIQSPNPNLPIFIRILPQWRDDAHLNLKQMLPSSSTKKKEVNMAVDMSTDPSQFKMTSLGRKAALANVTIDWKKEKFSLSNDSKDDSKDVGTKMKQANNVLDLPAYGFANTRDGCEFIPLPEDILLDEDEEDDGLVTNYDIAEMGSITLTAEVPQQCNLKCHVAGRGDITIESKLEGDVSLSTNMGDIFAHQLRGYHIDIQTCNGNISSTKNIEAQSIRLNIQQKGVVKAKMVNGSDIDIEVPHQYHNEMYFNDNGDKKNHEKSLENNQPEDKNVLVDISSLYTSHTGEGAHINIISNNNQVDDVPTSTLSSSSSSSNSNINTNLQHVKINSHHGHVTINTIYPPNSRFPNNDSYNNPVPLVELGGMNGSCDISIQSNEKREESENKTNSNQTTIVEDSTTKVSNKNKNYNIGKAAHVHVDSLAPNTISVITADQGDIGITFDRKVDTDLCLVSSPYISSLPIEDIIQEDGNAKDIHSALVQFDQLYQYPQPQNNHSNEDSHHHHHQQQQQHQQEQTERIHVSTSSFTDTSVEGKSTPTPSIPNQYSLQHVQYKYGQISNQSGEPDSRFDVQTKGIPSKQGKINVENAALQALHGFTKEGSGSGSGSDTSYMRQVELDPTIKKDNVNNDNSRSYEWPFMAVATSGRIEIDTVNWLGAIARRYGMGETKRDKELLGRQAKKSVSNE